MKNIILVLAIMFSFGNLQANDACIVDQNDDTMIITESWNNTFCEEQEAEYHGTKAGAIYSVFDIDLKWKEVYTGCDTDASYLAKD